MKKEKEHIDSLKDKSPFFSKSEMEDVKSFLGWEYKNVSLIKDFRDSMPSEERECLDAWLELDPDEFWAGWANTKSEVDLEYFEAWKISKELLFPDEISRLGLLGEEIRMSLDLDFTDLEDFGIPNDAHRADAIMNMKEYLEIHGYKVIF